jgi:hypothetical protein
MGKHDDLLRQGAHEAPEPETAEQRSKRVGWGTAGGGIVGGGIALAKFGGLAKIFIWLVAWNAATNAWRIGGWIAIALVIAAVAAFLVMRSRREA